MSLTLWITLAMVNVFPAGYAQHTWCLSPANSFFQLIIASGWSRRLYELLFERHKDKIRADDAPYETWKFKEVFFLNPVYQATSGLFLLENGKHAFCCCAVTPDQIFRRLPPHKAFHHYLAAALPWSQRTHKSNFSSAKAPICYPHLADRCILFLQQSNSFQHSARGAMPPIQGQELFYLYLALR